MTTKGDVLVCIHSGLYRAKIVSRCSKTEKKNDFKLQNKELNK